MLRLIILVCCLMAAPVFTKTSVLIIAQDRYEAGGAVRFEGPVLGRLVLSR